MTAALSLDDILARYQALPADVQKQVRDDALKATAKWYFIPNPGPQTDALYSEADELFFGGSAGGGKRLDDNTLVPVPVTTDPSGYKRHGDLMPGDYVYSPSGRAVRVLAVDNVTEAAESAEVVFNTGEVIVADVEHLWHTWTAAERRRKLTASEEWRAKRRASRPSRAVETSKKPWVSHNVTELNQQRIYEIDVPTGGVRSTKEIGLTLRDERGAANHSIDTTSALDGPDADLPVDPYMLGLWLGDGYTASGAIGMLLDDWKEIEGYCPPVKSEKHDCRPPRRRVYSTRRFDGFQSALRKLGLLGAKHIPAAFLRASKAQRVALFQGLMDTDGTCDTRGQMELGFSDERLALDALELASSLGIKASLCVKRTAAKIHYRFKFVAPFACFRLPRKLERQASATCGELTRRRYIVDVRPVDPRPMRCIQVDAEDGLYLVGRTYIATHNSALLCGVAVDHHDRAIIFRREYPQIKGLEDEVARLVGTRAGYNAQDKIWRLPNGNVLEFGSVPHETDVEKYQGRAHSLKGFDEITHFSEAQYRFLIGWTRSTNPEQRCRVIATGNPPTSPEGYWVVRYWAPWLDPTHPNPAKPGELRWFTTIEGKDVECAGPEEIEVGGRMVKPRSRTFIPARLEDNPDLMATGYAAVLEAMPEELRVRLRDGRFDAEVRDNEFQVIPTEWVRAAQARWTPKAPDGVGMSVLSHDVALGGGDANAYARRHGYWYDEIISERLSGNVDPIDLAARDMSLMRNGCPIVIDMGGGYGSGVYSHLKNNVAGLTLYGHNGSEASAKRDRSGKLKFANKRAEVWWRFREALEPNLGEPVALPPDPELLADLTAPTWKLTPRGLVIEDKVAIKARLGRSPDKGDCVVNAWAYGESSVSARIRVYSNPGRMPKINLGHADLKRRRG